MVKQMLEYKGILIYIHPKVYEPAEDTFLLAENLNIKRSDEVLEIGTGTGLIAICTAQRTRNVVATDVNDYALKCALKNTVANKTYNIELRKGNLFEAVESRKFDLILFNAPYLPTSECEKLDDDLNYALDGGKDGRETIDHFIDGLKDHLKEGGRVQLVQSSLSNNAKTLQRLEEMGFEAEITAREKCFFEEIVVINGKLK